MGKLFNLKEWLTVADAARHLSIVFDEEVTEADVLRLALDGRLRLSVNFVNGAIARCGRVSEELGKKVTEEGYRPPPKDILLLSASVELVPLGRVTHIFGLWDLPMIGNEVKDIESRFQRLTGGPSVLLSDFDGIIVNSRDNELCQIQVAWIEGDSEVAESYIAADRLPLDAVLVVRTEALREFERHCNNAPLPTSRANVSDKLAKMNQASMKFWSNADRDDRGTHPDNATVAAWLVQQGFSPTLADKAATIIRPEWAPTGRKPEE